MPRSFSRVRHGGTRDWEAAGRAWDRLAPLGKHLTGRTFKEADPVALGKDALKDVKLLHLTGRGAVALTEAERKALKEFVQGGGTIITLGNAAQFAIEQLGVLASNVIGTDDPEAFFCPGSLLRVEVDTDHPIGFPCSSSRRPTPRNSRSAPAPE